MSVRLLAVALGASCLIGCSLYEKEDAPPVRVGSMPTKPERQLPSFTANGSYGVFQINDWEVRMNQALIAQRTLALDVIDRLTEDLATIEQTLPAHSHDHLSSKVRIYLELALPLVPGGSYHPSEVWLIDNGYPAEWAKHVQLGNARNYLSWTSHQPAMLLHELAHAWHDQRWGANDGFIQSAYQNAMTHHLYDSVAYHDGTQKAAYAKTNYREYFAELSEAWFWKNDFFPTVRSELSDFDPVGADAVKTAWAP